MWISYGTYNKRPSVVQVYCFFGKGRSSCVGTTSVDTCRMEFTCAPSKSPSANPTLSPTQSLRPSLRPTTISPTPAPTPGPTNEVTKYLIVFYMIDFTLVNC